MSALLNTYRTGDEHWITVIVLEYDRYWKAFCDIVLKMPELAQDPRFSTQAAHFKHGQEQAAIIDEVFRNMSLSECIERLEQADIVYEINNRWHEIKNDTQALENGFLMEIKMPSGRKEWVAGNPVKFNGRKTLIRSHSPRLGQHTDEVLLELGYSQDDVAGLAGRKIIRK
jgi:crotonobetainyl-CoA:carnitine CoA-transferase CaiB-like acyl-CoA transferase